MPPATPAHTRPRQAASPTDNADGALADALYHGTMVIGILGRHELMPVPPWVAHELLDPANPGRVRQEGSERARAYLRDTYGVGGDRTVFWPGTLREALRNAWTHIDAHVPPSAYVHDRPDVAA